MMVEELNTLPLKSKTGKMYSITVDTESRSQHRRMLFDGNKANKKHVCACTLLDHYELQKFSRDWFGFLKH